MKQISKKQIYFRRGAIHSIGHMTLKTENVLKLINKWMTIYKEGDSISTYLSSFGAPKAMDTYNSYTNRSTCNLTCQ